MRAVFVFFLAAADTILGGRNAAGFEDVATNESVAFRTVSVVDRNLYTGIGVAADAL